MKKRIVSALLVCVLGMSLVTGCGNNAKAAETTKTADGKIQLDLWYSGGKTAVNVFQDIVDAFNESQDKYEVKTTTQADYTETYENCRQGLRERKLRTWHFWIQINPEIFLKKSGCRHQ